MKQLARLSGIAIACSISLAAQAAVAQSAAQLEIPAGELIAALKSLATQLDIDLVYQPDQLRNMRTEGVQGNYSAQQATQILLKGTPLEVRTDVSGAMVIAPALRQPAASTAQPSSSRIRLAQVSAPAPQASTELSEFARARRSHCHRHADPWARTAHRRQSGQRQRGADTSDRRVFGG